MSEKISFEAISRRKAISIFGLVGALGFAMSALTESDAQETTAPPATAPAAPATEGTPGMQRRQGRRANRHARRHARRTGQPAATAPAAAAPAAPAPAQ